MKLSFSPLFSFSKENLYFINGVRCTIASSDSVQRAQLHPEQERRQDCGQSVNCVSLCNKPCKTMCQTTAITDGEKLQYSRNRHEEKSHWLLFINEKKQFVSSFECIKFNRWHFCICGENLYAFFFLSPQNDACHRCWQIMWLSLFFPIVQTAFSHVLPSLWLCLDGWLPG